MNGGAEALQQVLWKTLKRLKPLAKVTVYRGKIARLMKFLPLYGAGPKY